MAAVNSELNAVVCDAHVAPAVTGPFAGIPSALKDNEDLAGLPTLHGSWAPADTPATKTSPWIAQYLALGLEPIAKTTLPEFGLTASTESSRFGATRNPWDTARSVGGSSGGSAALVAAGVVPIAHANDGGGSIRIPAAACGLVGLKPSRGRIIDAPELDRLPVNLVAQSDQGGPRRKSHSAAVLGKSVFWGVRSFDLRHSCGPFCLALCAQLTPRAHLPCRKRPNRARNLEPGYVSQQPNCSGFD
jgi:Asp-tRNA(Asn)/Glu-tRNA(Gln) amidotransferase A subunit family amidase